MDSEGEDEAFRAAIAASMQAVGRNRANGAVIDLTGDTSEEDDDKEENDDDVEPTNPKSKFVIGSHTDLKASAFANGDEDDEDDKAFKEALALSLQASHGQRESSNTQPTSAPSSEQTQKDQAELKSAGVGFLGLDRKKMEEERLARLAKRKAEEPPAAEPEAKQPRTEPQSSASSVQTKLASVASSVPSIQYPAGTVKKTFAFGYRRAEDDIKIEEVLQKSDLDLAVLSSFMWDTEWLFSKLDTRKSRLIMVMQARDEATKQQYQSETADMTNLRLCFPPMDGQVSCMHSKLMLLFHPGYLRIAIPTANLVPYDWGEAGGVMENSVFLIDLLKKDNTTSTNGQRTDFYTDLVYFLKATTLHENIIAKLEDFDFSKTARFAFTHTIGGSHSGASLKQTGYCGLGRAIESLGLKVSKPLNLDFVTSSLGSLTPEFIQCIYLAARGNDGLTEPAVRAAKSSYASTANEWKDRFRVYFPSQETVRRSKGGPNAAGTICFQSKWFENAKFPHHVLRDCVSARDGLVMHNKILYVQPDEPIPLSGTSTSQCLGWAYVGSANLSESAWGRLVNDRATKQPKLNCRNWECGVVIPVIKETEPRNEPEPKKEDTDSGSNFETVTGKGKGNEKGKEVKEDTCLLDIFKDTVPIPMRLPGPKYEASQDLKPWYFMEM
ncbi:tyrosyl-DNA phosphodiesterase [Aspergillus cavernicola]|uniref:Tyrosyl-DNA phosphodiesterase n=1 Tax=Aspergillus cavernicola TaxID=176166 RepID=A0ABR4IKD5_9EURO